MCVLYARLKKSVMPISIQDTIGRRSHVILTKNDQWYTTIRRLHWPLQQVSEFR